jgi:uncharacterized protein Yka (UPF0111/DUF47 family)
MDERGWRIEEARFIDIEIDTATLFLQLAFSESVNRPYTERFHQLIAGVRRARESAREHLPKVSDLDRQNELSEKLKMLNEAIEDFERRTGFGLTNKRDHEI